MHRPTLERVREIRHRRGDARANVRIGNHQLVLVEVADARSAAAHDDVAQVDVVERAARVKLAVSVPQLVPSMKYSNSVLDDGGAMCISIECQAFSESCVAGSTRPHAPISSMRTCPPWIEI